MVYVHLKVSMLFYRVIFELLWRDYFKFVGVKYGNRMFQVEGKMSKCLSLFLLLLLTEK